MKLLATFICLVLICLTMEAECRIHERSMDIRNPDIDPSWYTGRGIRPVGRFGRRGTALESSQRSGYRPSRQACISVEESNESIQDE
uniref:Prolactin-releasing peptide n=1 Tax=Geotrypetes seraphini TaxID=260995 RepID=A0A6P8RF19_GEOSA|nr:prolactin-releasing peptide [Geotrypetes seraphini]